MNSNPLGCIVCGYERGGTTLVSQLIRQHPAIDGRFECGFLLVDDLADFADLDVYVRNLKVGWGLTDESFEYIIQAPSYLVAYQRLVELSNLPDKDVRIFDKTPRYMENLTKILGKVDVPCVCVVRDPRGVYWSARKHWDPNELILNELEKYYLFIEKLPLPRFMRYWSRAFFKYKHKVNKIDWFSDYYLAYARGWEAANNLFPDRILLVKFEALCTNPAEETQRIYDFLGLKFELEYLDFPVQPDAIVNRGGILTGPIYEYQEGLSKRDQRQLLRNTNQFSEWLWID